MQQMKIVMKQVFNLIVKKLIVLENAGLNLDLSQMRLVLGSEQLLREQSARTLSQSVSAQR